jgi:acyl-coenzyme A thioesterase PaaI-like protein
MKAVFTRSEAGHWVASELAQGPFTGLQGGAVAGLLVAEIEQLAARDGLGHVAGICASFYRPTPLGNLHTEVKRLRVGRRASFVENNLRREDGELCASVRATLIQEQAVDLPAEAEPTASIDPSTFEPRKRMQAPHGRPWFMQTMQARMASDGTAWFKVEVPIIVGAGYFSRALGPADWCHGIHRPFIRALADPNQDLHVHLVRAPRGDWLGIRATTTWRNNGLGLGQGTLCDVHGDIGAVSMSVALVPHAMPVPATA